MSGEFALGQAIRQMLSTHPQPNKMQSMELPQCIEACVVCATVCIACADACLGEEMVAELIYCIRTNQDCADICRATGDILMRQSQDEWRLVFHQTEACRAACRTCADECEKHAEMHEHCRVCAEVCRQCEQACDKMLATFPV
jgi:hypothetical protein